MKPSGRGPVASCQFDGRILLIVRGKVEALLVDEEYTCCCTLVGLDPIHFGRTDSIGRWLRKRSVLRIVLALAPELAQLVLERLERLEHVACWQVQLLAAAARLVRATW